MSDIVVVEADQILRVDPDAQIIAVMSSGPMGPPGPPGSGGEGDFEFPLEFNDGTYTYRIEQHEAGLGIEVIENANILHKVLLGADLATGAEVEAITALTSRRAAGVQSEIAAYASDNRSFLRLIQDTHAYRVYIGNVDPDGVLDSEGYGAVFFHTDGTGIWLNTDGASAWTKVAPGGGGGLAVPITSYMWARTGTAPPDGVNSPTTGGVFQTHNWEDVGPSAGSDIIINANKDIEIATDGIYSFQGSIGMGVTAVGHTQTDWRFRFTSPTLGNVWAISATRYQPGNTLSPREPFSWSGFLDAGTIFQTQSRAAGVASAHNVDDGDMYIQRLDA